MSLLGLAVFLMVEGSRDWQLAGHFVLFPSFCWHGTRPFEAEGERVAVAFDLIPNG